MYGGGGAKGLTEVMRLGNTVLRPGNIVGRVHIIVGRLRRNEGPEFVTQLIGGERG